jgi:glycine cleavage system regulatory protein
MDFVSITDSTAQIRMKSTGYELYIKCAPSNGLKQHVTPILEKHQLKMAELKDAISKQSQGA